jgi:hypothetical protein
LAKVKVEAFEKRNKEWTEIVGSVELADELEHICSFIDIWAYLTVNRESEVS